MRLLAALLLLLPWTCRAQSQTAPAERRMVGGWTVHVSRELLGVDMSKAQQSSDWGQATLSDDQVAYAASDVLHLHALRARLDEMLVREGRDSLARACFEFLPTRAILDVRGWEEIDIFAHA
jgi:ribonuclease D